MYFFNKNTSNFIKIKLILLLILSVFFLTSEASSEEKFVGFIDTLEGKAFLNREDKKIELKEFDQVFTNDKIIIDTASSIIISFKDNSLLTLKEKSEFIVEEFDQSSSNPYFVLSIPNGKFSSCPFYFWL